MIEKFFGIENKKYNVWFCNLENRKEKEEIKMIRRRNKRCERNVGGKDVW